MTHPNIQPVGDRILVQYRDDKTEQVQGGVIIPESAREKPQEATVLALGSGHKHKHGKVTPFEVKVGDVVLVGRYSGADVKLGDQKFTLVREDDILGVMG
jgi:chaperonin GroES